MTLQSGERENAVLSNVFLNRYNGGICASFLAGITIIQYYVSALNR